MRCLLCGREKEERSLNDLLDGSDPLCSECRQAWERKDIRFQIDGFHAYAPYVYNEAFAGALIQFKECGDEALKDIFLFGLVKMMKRKYHGYTVLLMPSSVSKRRERGFSHLAEIFSCTGLNMMEPFEKKSDISQKQKGLYQRMEMQDEIILKKGIVLPEKTVLADDTITTGSTIRGALKCMDKTGRKIRIFALSANQTWLRK